MFLHSSHHDLSIEQQLNQLIMNAIEINASDIHIEPFEHFVQIRLRCDGLLRYHQQISFEQAQRIISRLKVMAKLDIAEKRKPQDGHLKWDIPSEISNTKIQQIDLRLSTLATLWGEKMVLRLLVGQELFALEQLGMTYEQQRQFQKALLSPQGIILVSGPTGSGKSSSLYTGLHLLNNEGCNICTVEEPVEIYLHGVNQVSVNDSIGLTFPQVLRTFLRQDPDILMIGEIRDKQIAEVAINAAQTGHLVLSTIHTNSAEEVISRLNAMGISSHNLYSTISLIIAQRLMRKICPFCCSTLNTVPVPLGKSLKVAQHKVANEEGCNSCYKGYSGRIAIFSVIPIEQLPRNEEELSSPKSYLTLQEHAILIIEAGMSTLDEYYRVLGETHV